MDNQIYNGENGNKKGTKEKIYLVIIIVLIVVFGAFVFYKKDVLFNKENEKINENQTQNNSKEVLEKEEQNKQEEQEEKDNNTNVNNENNIQVSEEEVKRAYYMLVPEGALYNELNDKNLETMAFGTIDKNLYNGTKLSDLTNKQKLVMALRYEDSINKFPICIGEEQSGATLQMTNFGTKIFKDTSFLKDYTNNSNLDVDNYRISTDEKIITVQNTNCGGIEKSSKDVTKLLNYKVEGTKLVLTIGAVHLELNEVADDGNWYNDTYNISNHNNTIQSHITEIDFAKHETYKAIFDLTNDGLYFESIERN